MTKYNSKKPFPYVVLKVRKITGNIFENVDLAREFEFNNDSHKTVFLSRFDMEKTRQKKKATDGTDIAIDLQDSKIKHGDVLSEGILKVLVRQTTEQVITAQIGNLDGPSLVLLGHIIGNIHRPVSIEKGSISFPIYKETELDLFRSLFGSMADKISLAIEEKIFQPHKSMNVHEH
ncbi:MAG: Urease accessory protein [Nitrosopumilaceae archaeon]|nr:Urease accessory protein [Nitrosopumilaceae archaeon]NDB88716.1 Urease accessory protein [Nitrososphaerota archaeon]NDF26326.1 Urease accessory protein [Nitrosopumilaceae archaeon]